MKVYLVRLAAPPGDTDPFVGVFAAQSVFELGLLVDEWVSPLECEYVAAPPGGVCWTPRYSPEFSEGWIPFVEEDEGVWREFGKRWLNRYFKWFGVWPESR
jgi:hypothetical protein